MYPTYKNETFQAHRANELWYKQVGDYSNSIVYSAFRRLVDLIICCIAIIPLLLLIPFVWFCNLFTSPGPIFYWQNRVGLNGAVFKILKLRTMRIDAEMKGISFTSKNDPRITWLGKWLRKSHLDELPQVYNILLGDMTLIGPRPERPEFTKELEKELADYQLRHLIKPGITGWAQIHQMYSANMEETAIKLDYDLYYLIHQNWLLDIYIMLRTAMLVFTFRGR